MLKEFSFIKASQMVVTCLKEGQTLKCEPYVPYINPVPYKKNHIPSNNVLTKYSTFTVKLEA